MRSCDRAGELQHLARAVASHHDPQQALELMGRERALLEGEFAAWQELATLSPAELRRQGVDRELVEAMTGKLGQHLDGLDQLEGGTLPAQLGLETVVPGRVYSGTQARVEGVVASYRRGGSQVEVHAEGDGAYRYQVVGHDGVTIELVAHGGERSSGPAPRAGRGVGGAVAPAHAEARVITDARTPAELRPVEHVVADVARATGRVALAVGGVEVAGPGALRLIDGGDGIPVRIAVADLGADGVRSTVAITDGGVVIQVSPRATALEVERELARRLFEGSAMVARRQAGKPMTTADALGKGAEGTFLSPADQGRVAELRVLRGQHAMAVAQHGARGAETVALSRDIKNLEQELRIVDRTPDAERRRRMVETQIIVQNDHGRRAGARADLDGDVGHAGLDLHNHFMGVVATEVFRRKAAEAAGGEDTGSWMPLLDRLAAMRGFEHQKGPGAEIAARSSAGDAVEIVREVRLQTLALKKSARGASAPDQRATDARIEGMAEDAVRAALTATDDTDFNSAYELRDELVKTAFAGALPPGADADAVKAHENHGYDEYAREAILRLAHDGIKYTEQSNSTKKLAERFGADHIERIVAELVARGELTPGQIDVRFLAMVPTRVFGERVDGNPEERHEPRPADDDSFRKVLGKSGAPVRDRTDTVGRDIAGAELYAIDGLGRERLQAMYLDHLELARATGAPTVFRPHVGEGSVDNTAGQPFARDRDRKRTADGALTHQVRARHNLEQLLVALEDLRVRGEFDSNLVIVRFGHATMATPDQVVRMRALGVLAEVNLGSNVRTGSADQTIGGVDGHTSPVEQYDDHVFGSAIYYGLDTLISTDGHDVMQTTMPHEYERAHQLLEEILTGERKVRVRATDAGDRGTVVAGSDSERWLAIEDLTAEERARFLHGYEKLHADADAYYQHRPRPSDPAGAVAGGDHWTDLAETYGLRSDGVLRFVGTRAQIDEAVTAYRRRGELVMVDEQAGQPLRVRVTARDGRAELVLDEVAGGTSTVRAPGATGAGQDGAR